MVTEVEVFFRRVDYEAVSTKMVDSLKPGGWLVQEETDFSASRSITGGECRK